MSVYAVIDPATGETVKEYPTISDDELRDAIALADETFRTWSSCIRGRKATRLESCWDSSLRLASSWQRSTPSLQQARFAGR